MGEILEDHMSLDRENIYYFNGTAYAGKSTMVKRLAEKYDGIACEENYHDELLETLDKEEYPCLTYTRDLQDWHDFIRRSPKEYAAWIDGVTLECEKLELQILEKLSARGKKSIGQSKKIFVDTNISVETLWKISDKNHVAIMLADPEISVRRFFERPDKEKQFLYRLLLEEKDPYAALENFRQCLKLINSKENYDKFERSGFNVFVRDENRSIEDTMRLVEKSFGLI